MKVRLLVVSAIFCLMSAVAFAQGPAGKWTGELQGGRGPQAVTLDLKVAGAALTGTITFGQGMPIDITEGKIDGNKVMFKATGGGGGGGRGGGGGGAAGAGAGGGGGRGGGGGGAPAGAAAGGAPPAGGAPAAGGGGGQGGGGGRGGGGGGAAFSYTGTINGNEMAVSREAAAPAGGAAPAAGGAAPAPQTFTLKRG